MSGNSLSADDQARVDQILDRVMGMARSELEQAAAMLVTRPNSEFFGQTEFLLRDAVHRIGARLLDAALEERKKGGTLGAPSAARSAEPTPSS